METSQALIHAILLDTKGKEHCLTWPEIRAWTPDQGFLWMHWQLDKPGTQEWLEQESGFDPVVVHFLLDEDNHPRIVWEEDLLFGTLRGINLNDQADPEDMVFINLYMDANRAITTRKERVLTIHTIAQAIHQGQGPTNPGELLTGILMQLHDNMEPTLEKIEQELDNDEHALITGQEEIETLRDRLIDLRQEIIEIHRFLAPQKTALATLGKASLSWLNKKRLREIREIEDRLQRFLGDLESYRERAIVMREEINNHANERMNRAMYMLSIITGIFLPLSFLTGLLGINVGGMPGVENPLAFWIVCFAMIVILVVNLLVFRKKRWL